MIFSRDLVSEKSLAFRAVPSPKVSLGGVDLEASATVVGAFFGSARIDCFMSKRLGDPSVNQFKKLPVVFDDAEDGCSHASPESNFLNIHHSYSFQECGGSAVPLRRRGRQPNVLLWNSGRAVKGGAA